MQQRRRSFKFICSPPSPTRWILPIHPSILVLNSTHSMSPMRTRAYTKRQQAENEAEAAAEAATAVTPTTGTSPANSLVPRDTRQPPIRKTPFCNTFFHITREDGQEHMILLERSRVDILVQPRPRRPSSNGSTSSSCNSRAAGDKPALSAPTIDLETSLASDIEDNAEIHPPPHPVRQRCPTTHYALIAQLSEGAEEDAPSSRRTRLVMDHVLVPPRCNLKRRDTCSRASRNDCQLPIVASTIQHRTCPLETTTSPDHHGPHVDELPAHSQAETRRPKHGCYLTGFLVFCCLAVLVFLARPLRYT
ncbi:hypothetical protein LXA43DRAFT_253993 [Ganoderma leucocontextum]|nr:hypothetical protein LXA43DRAFT_253993 [Ganoderma leucocontextum]